MKQNKWKWSPKDLSIWQKMFHSFIKLLPLESRSFYQFMIIFYDSFIILRMCFIEFFVSIHETIYNMMLASFFLSFSWLFIMKLLHICIIMSLLQLFSTVVIIVKAIQLAQE